MGMDLYSARKPRGKKHLYYRFNAFGWGTFLDFLQDLGCDLSEFSGSNDGDLVSADTCADIATRLAEIKASLHALMIMDPKELPGILPTHNKIVMVNENKEVDVAQEIITGRLAGRTFDPACLTYKDSNTWTMWDRLAYYLGFGNFCSGCAKLGGFKQC